MRIYDKLWQAIKQEDWPKAGEIFICLDPQKRLGPQTWTVSEFHNHDTEIDVVGRGLFWKKDDAVIFANAVEGST